MLRANGGRGAGEDGAPRSGGDRALRRRALGAGLFEEAEERYRDALALAPELARGHHGMARSLAARSKLDEAMDEAQAALRLSPRDLELHHTVGAIYERMHQYEEAAAAYTNYVNLLPNKDTQREGRLVARGDPVPAVVRPAVPFDMDPGTEDEVYTVDFRLVNDKVVVRAKVNDGWRRTSSSTPAPRTR